MGASGAGKTSLLNALSDRIALKRGCTLHGEVLLNDKIKLT
jgi:ABC-type phosphate transport system ATPase subunit